MRKAILVGSAALIALTALLSTGTASATVLEIGGEEANNEPVTFKATLAPESSWSFTYTGGEVLETCTQSELHAKTEQPFFGESVTGAVSAMTFTGNCNVVVHKPGELHFEHIAGTTNAIVRLSGAEITIFALGGYVNCKTGPVSELGRLTGVKEGHATFHLNLVVGCGFAYPTLVWRGTYRVTSPTGLGADVGPPPDPPDPMLELGGSPRDESVSLEASLQPETSTLFKSTGGELINTCAGAEIKGSTTSPYAGEEAHGKLSKLSWSGCSHSLTTFSTGSFSISRIPGTTNGPVRLSGAFTFKSALGTSYVCFINNTVGTLTGVKEGHATLEINAVLNCGSMASSVRWEGTYTVTSPTGLGVNG
ncbi:MAG TPA: hypothetical protein VFZ29_06985 [Solirubrobacterales bacterium]